MNYEIQQALRDKADNWQLHSLESQLSSTKQDVTRLATDLNSLESTYRNQTYQLQQLISLIISSNIMESGNEQLQQIKQYL